jgi:hypothetical protein
MTTIIGRPEVEASKVLANLPQDPTIDRIVEDIFEKKSNPDLARRARAAQFKRVEGIMHRHPVYREFCQDQDTRNHVRKVIGSYNLADEVVCAAYCFRRRDRITDDHETRAAVMGALFGRALGLGLEETVSLSKACGGHDAGKILTPYDMLHLPMAPTREQWIEHFVPHALRTAQIMLAINRNLTQKYGANAEGMLFSDDEVLAGLGHHKLVLYIPEKAGWRLVDYPDDSIMPGTTFYSRCVKIVDAYDSMKDPKHIWGGKMRTPKSNQEAYAELERCSQLSDRHEIGIEFDPDLIKPFGRIILS